MNNLYICPITLEIKDFSNPITVSEGLVIRKIKEGERCEIFGKIVTSRATKDDSTRTVSLTCCTNTVLRYPEPNIEASGKAEILAHHYYNLLHSEYIIECDNDIKIGHLINTFLIHKEGFIHAPYSFNENGTGLHYPLYLKKDIPYILELKDIEDIRSLYNKLSTSNDKTKTCIDRYRRSLDINLSDSESYFQKVSLLESCLIEGSKELSFRFSLCLSSLLTNEIRFDLSFEKAKEIYKIRSEIAHEGKSDKLTKEEYILLRTCTREIIKWYILNGSPNKILELVIHRKLNI